MSISEFKGYLNLLWMLVSLLMNFAVDCPNPNIPCITKAVIIPSLPPSLALTPLPDAPPDIRRIKKMVAPSMSRVGVIFSSSFSQSASPTYVTGSRLGGSMPRSDWACSRLRSKESTLPMLKVKMEGPWDQEFQNAHLSF